MKYLWIAACVVGGSFVSYGQSRFSFDVVNPKLGGLKVLPSVTAVGGMYAYSYVVDNGVASTGAVSSFSLDVSGDPTGALVADDQSQGRVLARLSEVPICKIGIAPPARWQAAVGVKGEVTFILDGLDETGPLGLSMDFEQMAPGKRSPPLVIRSAAPPGVRSWTVSPDWEPALGTSIYADALEADAHGQTLGPVPLGEGEQLFRVGSNNPAVVDKFLMFRVPQQKTTTLTAGQKVFIVIKFGPTVNPATFSATWNGQNISNLFAVSADDFAAVQLEPKSGKNIFQVSIKGTKSGGQTATDSDKLIWTAP